ncbi:hypothetical protein D3C73_1211550 [compost metagenome]
MIGALTNGLGRLMNLSHHIFKLGCHYSKAIRQLSDFILAIDVYALSKITLSHLLCNCCQLFKWIYKFKACNIGDK